MDHLWRESTLGRSEFWVWNHKPLTGSPRLHSPWKRFFHGVLWAGKYFISVFYTFKSKNCSFRKKWTHAFGNWSSLSPELVTVELASADVIHAVIWFLGSLSNHDFYWPLSCLWTSITSQYQHFRDSKCSSLRVDQCLILSERVTTWHMSLHQTWGGKISTHHYRNTWIKIANTACNKGCPHQLSITPPNTGWDHPHPCDLHYQVTAVPSLPPFVSFQPASLQAPENAELKQTTCRLLSI